GAAGSYVYDYGVAHLLELQRVGDVAALLTSFPYLMARLAAATKTDVKQSVDRLLHDYAAVHGMAAALDDDGRAELEKWQLHVSRFANLLQRGTPEWGAHRILHQVTGDRDEGDLAAEAYRWSARSGHPPLQRIGSSREVAPRGLVRVLDTGPVVAVVEIGGGRVISATHDGFLQVWDVRTGRREGFWTTSGDLIGAVVLAEDCIATCGRDGAVGRWRLSDRSQIANYTAPIGKASCVAALPAIGQLVIGDTDGRLHLVDPREARSTVLIGQEHSSRIESIIVFGGLRLATVSHKAMVRLLRSPRSALPASARDGHSLSTTGVKKVGDGRWQLHFLEWQLFCWDLQNGDGQFFSDDDDETNGLAVMPDGTVATSSSWDAAIQLHHPSGTTTLLKGHEDRITCAVSLEGGRVATGSADGTIRIWSTEAGQQLGVLQSSQPVRQLMLLTDGRLLQWGEDQADVRIWDPSHASVDAIHRHKGAIAGVVVLSDGRLVTYGYEGAIVIWDRSGPPLVRLEGHSDFVRQVHELGNGLLLSSSWDGSVRIWETEFGRQVNAIEGLGRIDGAVMAKPNVIVAWYGGTLVRWRLGEGWRGMLHRKQEVHKISLPSSATICRLMPLPGGLVAANCLTEIDLWDVEKESIVHRIEAGDAIFEPAFVVLEAGPLVTMREGSLQVWSIESGAMMASWDVGTRNETIWRMLALSDGSVAILSRESGVHVCDPNTGRRRSQFPLPGSMSPTGVFLCGDRHLGVFDAEAGIIQIHETATGRLAARSDDVTAITQVAAIGQSAGAWCQLVVVGASPRPIVLQSNLE
ncbi:MAG: repeat-like protein, partial [Acidobacteria bacterium]|nr:repeat-like protein [Acidobacteriota bacterium]